MSLLNPRRVKQYACSAGKRNKTDRLDAAIIADFIFAHQPAAWQPPAPEVAQLQALVRRREELSLMVQAEKNRLEGIAPNVRCSVERILSALSAEKARLEKLILGQIRSHQQLWRDHQLLCSIKGIGSLTAAILLAEMARPGQVERARQAAAHAGLAPRREQRSGQRGQSPSSQGSLHACPGSHQTQCTPESLCFPTSRRRQTQNDHRLRGHAQTDPHRLRCAQTSKTL